MLSRLKSPDKRIPSEEIRLSIKWCCLNVFHLFSCIHIIIDDAHSGAVSQAQERGIVALGSYYLGKNFVRFSSASALECGLSCGWDNCFGVVKEANRKRVHLDWEKIVQIYDIYSVKGASRVNLESEAFGR